MAYEGPYQNPAEAISGTSTPDRVMSPQTMAALGFGSWLLGEGLQYYGNRQGAQAMEQEARRQAAEQEQFGAMRHARIMDQIGRFSPAEGPALGQVALQRRMGAINPAMAAAGRRLGLGGADVAHAKSAIMPMQRVAASGDRAAIQASRQGPMDARMAQELDALEAQREMAAANYGARTTLAGGRGEAYRTGGMMLSGAGIPLIGMAMGQRGT